MSDLDSVVKLYTTQQHAEGLHQRHVAAVSTLCKANSAGFALQDIPKVVQVLDALLALIRNGNNIFVEPACCLIRTLAKPYSKRSSTDELKLPGILTELLITLAQCLQQGMPAQLQICTAEMLADFSSSYNNRPAQLEAAQVSPAAGDLSSVQRLYNTHQSLLAQSGIAPVVCATMQTALDTYTATDSDRPPTSSIAAYHPGSRGTASSSDPSEDLAAALLLVLLNFSYSKVLCGQLIKPGVLRLAVQLLQRLVPASDSSTPSKGSLKITQVVELLWNLLEIAPDAARGAFLPAVQRPRAGAPQIQAADAATAVVDDSNQQQQPGTVTGQTEQGLTQQPPWATASTPPQLPADMWVRQSCSTGGVAHSRPASGLAAHSLESESSSLQVAVDDAAESAAADIRAATAYSCWPGSAVNTPEPNSELDLQQQERVAAELIDTLGALFKLQLRDTSSKQAKEARNDTLSVLHHLSSIPSCCRAMADSSLMAVLLAAAVTPELQPSSQHVPAGALSKEDVDHELKLLVWATLGNAAANSNEALAAIAAGGLLRCLLLVTDESSGTSSFAVGRWNPEQLVALRRLAWSVLQQVAPLCKPDFCSCNGVAILVRHLANCYGNPAVATYSSAGSESPGAAMSPGRTLTSTQQTGFTTGSSTLARRNGGNIIEPALRLVQRLVTGDTGMASAFADAGILPVLLQLLQSPVCGDIEAVRAGVLLVLAELCEAGGSSCREQLRQADGVGVLLKECQDVLQGDSSLPNLVGLSALDCLWRCCLPSSRCRAQLLALDGMDVLLQLLSKGNKHYRPVVLSMLADLLSDKRSHTFFMEWHSPTSTILPAAAANSNSSSTPSSPSRALRPATISGTQLLLNIWRELDQARGLTGADGVLANPARPLAGLGEPTKWSIDGAAGAYGQLQGERQGHMARMKAAGATDLLMDKVFACFSQIGFDAAAAGLPPTDAAVLAFIRQYVKFRQGEVWQDVKTEFEAAGLTPTQEDGVRVTSGIQHSELTANQVAELQRTLLASATQEQLAAEKATYDAMLAQAAADAKSRVYEKDSSKLTMRERLAAKARKEDMLKHSLANSLNSATAAVTGGLSSAGPGSLSSRSTVSR